MDPMSVALTNWLRWAARSATLSLAAVLALVHTGCTALQGVQEYIAYNDLTNDFVLGWRNSAWARQAWQMRRDNFLDQPYLEHFGAGFRAGYISVASGGNGCTPALPPREYWSWKYQTPEGQGKVAAWFSGFPHGARAAEEDGAGNWSQIQVSETLRREYQLGHEPPYTNHVYLYDPAHCCPPGLPPGATSPPLEQPLDAPHEHVAPPAGIPEGLQPGVSPAAPELGANALYAPRHSVSKVSYSRPPTPERLPAP